MNFNKIAHPCVAIDVLADVWVEYVIEIIVGVFTSNLWGDVVIGTLSGVTIDVVCDIGAEALTNLNANVSVVAMSDL